MHRKYLKQYFKTDGWYTPSVGEKSVDKLYDTMYNEDKGTTNDINDTWKKSNEKELRYAGDSARESVDKGLDYVPKFMKDAPEGTDYGKVQTASVKWSLANDANNKELQQSAFDELTGHLSAENKDAYLKKARPLQEFVDAKDTFDYQRKNYTTTKNSTQRFDQAIQNMQRRLNEKGYTDKFGEKLKEDGIMGAKTQHAYDQMLEAENAKSTQNDKAEQPVAPAQAVEPTPTQTAETNNRTRESMEKYHTVELASRGGTRNSSKTRGISSKEMASKDMYIKPTPPKLVVPKVEERIPIETKLYNEGKMGKELYDAFDFLSQRWYYATTIEARAEIAALAKSVRDSNYNVTDCTKEANKQLWDNGQRILKWSEFNKDMSSVVSYLTGLVGGLIVDASGIAINGIDWYNNVKNTGIWDYKVNDSEADWLPNENYFLYYGQLISKADFGNINYGYTGTLLGLTPETLYKAGGKVANNPTQYEVENYYSDSEVDHYWIKKGIEQANQQGYYGILDLPVDLIFKVL